MDQQLPHLLLRPVVLGVGRLFLCHEPCKFFVQAPDRGQLFQTERIKGFLRRLVDEDVALMLRKIFFRVPRLAVAGVNAAGSGIVHDVRPQGLYLAHTRFRRLYGRPQIIEPLLRIGGGIDKCVEIGKALFLQIYQRLCHLLELYHLHRLIVAVAFSCVELRLNVGNQRGALPALRIFFPDEGLVRPASRKDGAQLLLGISLAQRIQADALFLVFVPQRQPALSGDGIAAILQKRQQRVEVLWLLFKRRVYRHAQKIAVGELVVTAAPFVVAQPVFLWILHHGQPVLGADQVGQPADGAVAPDEVIELPRTVQRRGVPVDVVVNVLFVGVGANEEKRPG